jgi:flagellar M-ring protein FliF
VSRMTFGGTDAALAAQQKAEDEAKAAEQQQATMGMVRQGVVVLFLLGLLAFVYRTMRKAARRRSGSPGLYAGDVREITPAPIDPEPLSLEPAEAPFAEASVELPEPAILEPERSEEELERDRISKQVEEMIDQQPMEVAQMLRGWLDGGKAAAR